MKVKVQIFILLSIMATSTFGKPPENNVRQASMGVKFWGMAAMFKGLEAKGQGEHNIKILTSNLDITIEEAHELADFLVLSSSKMDELSAKEADPVVCGKGANDNASAARYMDTMQDISHGVYTKQLGIARLNVSENAFSELIRHLEQKNKRKSGTSHRSLTKDIAAGLQVERLSEICSARRVKYNISGGTEG